MLKRILFIFLWSVIAFGQETKGPVKPGYFREAAIVNNIYTLYGSAFTGSYTCNVPKYYREYRDYDDGNGFQLWNTTGTLSILEFTNGPGSKYTSYVIEYEEGEYNDPSLPPPNFWFWKKYRSYGGTDIFEGNSEFDIVGINLIDDGQTKFLGGNGHYYYTNWASYDLYAVEVNGISLGVEEIEVSEELINNVIDDELYTSFPKTVGSSISFTLYAPSINCNNGYFTLTAPIRVAGINGSFSVNITPAYTSWTPVPFGPTLNAYAIILDDMNIEVGDIILSQSLLTGLTEPVINDLLDEICALDEPIPFYPVVQFQEQIDINYLSTQLNFTLTPLNPEFRNNKMILRIHTSLN